jgi:hydrogenase/urease accessory protein HupE
MSVLLFYRHIFFITEGYRQASLAVMVVSTAWFIAAQVASLLICQPIDSFWIRTKPGTCLNFNVMFLGTGIVDAIIAIFISLLPICMALKLQLPRKTKFAIAGIFGLGGVVVITNIVRIKYIYQPNQIYGKSHNDPISLLS